MKTYHRFWINIIPVLILTFSVFIGSNATAQQGVEILDKKVEYTFGGQATFWAKAQWDTPPEKVQIFFKSIDQTNTIVGEVNVRGDELIYVHDLVQYPLKAFAEIQYWYGIQMPGKDPYISPKYTFFYKDNRFSWKTLDDAPFRVNWYEGDLAFGQMVLDIAQASLEKAQRLLAFPNPEHVEIFVYANGAEMQSTLNLGGIAIVAGHASPELGVMMVSLPPGPYAQGETERQVPHELMHILLYQKMGKDYADLPTWLVEGLASLNETNQNLDYLKALSDAFVEETIMPMSSLCNAFPEGGTIFYQSYAQADSFTRYLYKHYGAEKMQSMIQAYANGLDCERGAEVGVGKTLTQLDAQWQWQTFHLDPVIVKLKEVLPWAVIFILLLLPPILLVFTSLLRGKANSKKVDEKSSVPGGFNG